MTKTKSSEKTKQAIIDAAGELLVNEGFDAVTHRTVAHLAGVPLGSTTYHFKDKTDLLFEVFKNLFEIEKLRREAIIVPKIGNPLAVTNYLNDLLIPPEFRTKKKLALMYQRILEATQDARIRKLLDQDQQHIARALHQQLHNWNIGLAPGLVQALFEGRVLQSLSNTKNLTDYKELFATDLKRLTKP